MIVLGDDEQLELPLDEVVETENVVESVVPNADDAVGPHSNS